MWILVDDTRDLQADVIIRSSQAADEVLTYLNLRYDTLLLDHDLGKYSDEDGYFVMMEHIILRSNSTRPQYVQLVTENPVGRERMRAALVNDARYVEVEPGKFRRGE